MEETFSTGLIASPEDIRDIPLSAIAPIPVRIPESMPPIFNLEILDQNGYPACVGFSCAAIKQDRELREKNNIVFDGKWIYDECKKIDGIPNVNGTYFRTGMEVLYKFGAKPINGGDPARFKIGSYAILDKIDADEIKKAILLYGSVLAGFNGSNAGWKSEIVRKPNAGEAIWQHAVALVGYNKNYFIVHNSWGKDKGNNGMFLVPIDYLPFEVWVVMTDLPTPLPGTIGWSAIQTIDGKTKYIVNGITTTNLNLRESPNGKILKVIPRWTAVLVLPEDEVSMGGYIWNKVQI